MPTHALLMSIRAVALRALSSGQLATGYGRRGNQNVGLCVACNRLMRTALAATLLAILCACGSLPTLQKRAPTNAGVASSSTVLAKIVMASTPPGEHSGFRLMPLGVYSLDARVQLARRAQQSLAVQYYEFEDDGAGRLLMRALREAAGRGVQVRVLVDDMHTATSQQPLLALSQTPNVEVRLYNPFCCGRSGVFSRFAASPLEISRLNRRMHNKLFVADGVMAVIGGRNIADEYFLLSEVQNFIDIDALVVGRVVPELEAVFDSFWNSDEVWPIAEIVKGEGGRRPTGEDFDHWTDVSVPEPHIVLPSSDLLGYGPISEEFDDGRIGLVWGEAHAVADPPSKAHAMSAEEALSTSVTMKVWRLIRDAVSEVALTSPYLVPGERGMEIIDDLTRQRVRVTLLTNSLAANDVPLVHTAYARYRRPLLTRGVELYELSPGRTNASLRFGVFGRSLGRLHAKLLTIDRRLVFIGSMNLDPRSATQNTEIGVLVNSEELAREVLRVIDVSKAQNSYRLRLDATTGRLQWLTGEGEKQVILDTEPETGFFQRLFIPLVGPFIPESLL